MYGAIIGDIVGQPYESKRVAAPEKDFTLFKPYNHFTDDTVMTVAVAEALMEAGGDAGLERIKEHAVRSMRKWGRRYPHAGYGRAFKSWLFTKDPKPYGSWGNGSAMRVSPVAWLYDDLEQVLEVSKAVAEVTHDHPEGIKGAQGAAGALFLARSGLGKEKIRAFLEGTIGYDLSFTIDGIRDIYTFSSACQASVPQALEAFLEGESFEDVIRTAVYLGGDSDTIAAIAGSVAEAYYPVPEEMIEEARSRLTPDLLEVVDRFYQRAGACRRSSFHV